MSDFNNIRFQPLRPLLRELSADRLNTILQEIKRNKPRGERGITVRQDGNGTYIGLAASLPRGAYSTSRQPWDLIPRPDPDANPEDENPPYKIRVQPGTLNGILAVNWDEEFTAQSTGLYYAKAVITTDGEAITSVNIDIDTQPPIGQDPQEFAIAETVEFVFGLFAEGAVYRAIGPGSITLLPRQWFVVQSDPAAAPGELPYDIYYRLSQ
jgi:hypothetical protein